MTNPLATIKAVSSKRSEEIEPKAGIAIANRKGQFAPKEREVFIKNKIRKMFSLRKEHFADLEIECGFILNPIVYAARLTVFHQLWMAHRSLHRDQNCFLERR